MIITNVSDITKMQDRELRADGSSYDFGARMYNADYGRFFSLDPMITKFPFYSPYLFAGDNPIRYIDINGLLPGDPFKTAEQAAHDFGKNYNSVSMAIGLEVSTQIYKYTDKDNQERYTYAIPNAICETGSKSSLSTIDTPGYVLAGNAHTHGENRKDKINPNEFSETDKKNSNNKEKNPNLLPQFIITPDGFLKKYDPKNPKQILLLNTDLPEDQGSPKKNFNLVEKNPDKRKIPIKVLPAGAVNYDQLEVRDAKTEIPIEGVK